MKFVNSFKDLEVYQYATELSNELFRFTLTLPREEMFSLTDQIRRSSRSVGAQIAEAWAMRRYERQFVNKLTIALAENFETKHWIDTAHSCGYASTIVTESWMEKCNTIGRMISSMIAHHDRFCKSSPPDKTNKS
jgi:four helix bundle protein